MHGVWESILSAPAIKIMDADAHVYNNIVCLHHRCPTLNLPPNFDKSIAGTILTNLVLLGRKHAHSRGLLLPGHSSCQGIIVGCGRGRQGHGSCGLGGGHRGEDDDDNNGGGGKGDAGNGGGGGGHHRFFCFSPPSPGGGAWKGGVLLWTIILLEFLV